MAEGDDDYGLGDDFEEIEDLDGERGAVALVCSPATGAAARFRFFDDLTEALRADQQPCPAEHCCGAHSIALRDGRGEVVALPIPGDVRTSGELTQLAAAPPTVPTRRRRQPDAFCKNGHPYDDTCWEKSRDGSRHRRCRECRRQNAKKEARNDDD